MRPRALLALPLLAAALPGCQLIGAGENTDTTLSDIAADVAEFLGQTNPSRHLVRLADAHDEATWEHRPALPPTDDACVAAIRTLGSCDYDSWRDLGFATLFLARCAVDDPSSLSRVEAVGALHRLGRLAAEAEVRPAGGVDTAEALRVVKALVALHSGSEAVHSPDTPEAAAECTALIARLGEVSADAPAAAGAADLRERLSLVRGCQRAILVTGFVDEDRGPAAAAAVDRTVVNLAAQAARLALQLTLLEDKREPVRAAAAAALGHLAGATPAAAAAVTPSLAAALGRERSPVVRRDLAVALGTAAARLDPAARGAAVLPLLASLEDDDLSVRRLARAALAPLAGQDLGPDREPWVRWWAAAGR